MTKTRGLLIIIAFMLVAGSVWSLSDALYPENWKEWPVVKESAIPAADVPVPKNLSDMHQQFQKTYSWLNGGDGEHYKIRVNPEQLGAYKKGKGFDEGPIAVLEFQNSEIVLVTEFFAGEPSYGIFDTTGDDLEFSRKTLSLEYCEACHQWYKEECEDGVCSN